MAQVALGKSRCNEQALDLLNEAQQTCLRSSKTRVILDIALMIIVYNDGDTDGCNDNKHDDNDNDNDNVNDDDDDDDDDDETRQRDNGETLHCSWSCFSRCHFALSEQVDVQLRH